MRPLREYDRGAAFPFLECAFGAILLVFPLSDSFHGFYTDARRNGKRTIYRNHESHSVEIADAAKCCIVSYVLFYRKKLYFFFFLFSFYLIRTRCGTFICLAVVCGGANGNVSYISN